MYRWAYLKTIFPHFNLNSPYFSTLTTSVTMVFAQAIVLVLLAQSCTGFHNALFPRRTHSKERHPGYVSIVNKAMIQNGIFDPVLFDQCENFITQLTILVEKLKKKAHDVKERPKSKSPSIRLEKLAQKYARSLEHVIYLECRRYFQKLKKVASRPRIKLEPKDYIGQLVTNTPLRISGSATYEQRDIGLVKNERRRPSSLVQKLRDRMVRFTPPDDIDFSDVKTTAFGRVFHLLWKNIMPVAIIMVMLFCFFGDRNWYNKIAGLTRNNGATAVLNGSRAAEIPLLAMERGAERLNWFKMDFSLSTKHDMTLASKGSASFENTNEDQVLIPMPVSPQPLASTPKPSPIGETTSEGIMNKVTLPSDWSISPIASPSSSYDWYNEVSRTSLDSTRVRSGEKELLESKMSSQSPTDIDL